MLFARNFGVSSPHDTCGWHSCAECLLKLGCARVRICDRVSGRVYVYARSTRAFVVPCVRSKLLRSLGRASPLSILSRARAHLHRYTSMLLYATRRLSFSLALSLCESRSRFNPLWLRAFFSCARTKVGRWPGARTRRAERKRERKREARWTEGGKERVPGAERVDRWAPTTPKVRAPPPPPPFCSSSFLVPPRPSSTDASSYGSPSGLLVPPWTNCWGGGATPAL